MSDRYGDGKDIRSKGRRGPALSSMGRGRRLQGGRQCQPRRNLHHHDPAAQRHRCFAHGPRLQQHAARHPCALAPDAWVRHALAARSGPRRHRHTIAGRKDAGRRTIARPRRTGPHRLFGKSLGMERAIWLDHHRPAQTLGRVLRLVAQCLHHGRGVSRRGPQGLCRSL